MNTQALQITTVKFLEVNDRAGAIRFGRTLNSNSHSLLDVSCHNDIINVMG